MKRIAKISFLILLLLVAATLLGARMYLRSSRVLTEIADQIAAVYGGPVRIGGVDIGFTASSIYDLQLFEPKRNGPEDEPWLTASSVTADLSLWNLIRGERMPKRVRIQGAKVVLQFDSAGQLRTELPSQALSGNQSVPGDDVPQIVMAGAEVVFRKAGFGDFTARNIHAEVDRKPGRLVLAGTAESDVGQVELAGTLEEKSTLATASISTLAEAHVTQSILDRLPFIPPSILKLVHIHNSAAKGILTASYDLKKKAFHYHVDLTAQRANMNFPNMGVTILQGSGQMVIDDNRIQLRNTKGHAFGGVVYADGVLDFRKANVHMNFPELRAENLEVKDVPESWNIPATVRKSIISGKLYGRASADILIGAGDLDAAAAAALIAQGAAHGLTQTPAIATIPHDRIRITTKGKGQVRDPLGKRAPIEFDWQLTPHPVSQREEAEKPWDKVLRSQGFESSQGLLTTFVVLDTNLSEPIAQPKPVKSNYFDLKFNLKNANLAEIAKNEDLKLPFPLEGKISFHVKASIPVDHLGDLKAYKAEGSAQVASLVVAGIKLGELITDFKYSDGVLYLEKLKSDLADDAGKKPAPGSLTGNGRIQLVPLGEVQADLKLERMPVSRLAGQPPDQIQGTVSGQLSIRGRADKLQNAGGIEANGKLASDRLTIHGFELEKLATSVKFKDGLVSFPDLRVRVEGIDFAPSASVRMNADHTFVAKAELRAWDLAAVQKIAAQRQISLPPLTGKVNVKLSIKGELKPGKVELSADIDTQSVKLDNAEAMDIAVHCVLEDQKLKITDLNASLFDGKATGSAVLPFDGKTPGTVNLRVQNLNVQQLAKDLRMPIEMSGRVDGTLKGTLPAIGKGQNRKAIFEVDVKAPALRVQKIPTEQLQGAFEYQQGLIDYRLTGKTLGGTFDLEGQIPGGSKPLLKKDKKAKEGRLRFKDIHVGRLFDALGANTERRLRGVLNIDVRYKHEGADLFPHGAGSLRISNVQWGDTLLAENLQGDIVLADQQIRLRNLGGDLGQGTVTGYVAYYLREPERSSFSLNLDGIESGLVLSPWFEKKVEGSIQARIRGKLGRAWKGNADFELARGKVYGLEITQWRLPIVWNFSPRQGRVQANISETSGQVAGGRANGKMTFAWDHSARLEGSIRADRVELRDLLRQIMGKSDLGSGKTSARFDFKGTDARSLNDVNGTLTAVFQDTQALQVPVLQQIAPFLGIGPSTTFQKGVLRARLQRGSATIQTCTLQGSNVQVFIDGSISLDERLNLHVVAKTGDVGWPTIRLGPIGVRIPIAGPVPLVLLQEVSALLSNHVAYLDVTGTPRSPVIRPRPVPILSQEAVRFFLYRSNSPIVLNP